MKTTPVFFLLVVSICLNGVDSTVKHTVLCNTATEPSLADIVNLFSVIQINRYNSEQEHTLNGEKHNEGLYKSISNSFSLVLHQTKLPLSILISDGVFRINRSQSGGLADYSDVVLLQQKPLWQQLACNISGILTECRCRNGEELSQHTEILPLSVGAHQEWCIHFEPCTATVTAKDMCLLKVDPFHSACIGYLSQSDDISEATYKLDTPTIGLVGWDGIAISVPVYPIMILVACFLLALEEDIASSSVVKYLVSSIFEVTKITSITALLYKLGSYTMIYNLSFGHYLEPVLSAILMGPLFKYVLRFGLYTLSNSASLRGYLETVISALSMVQALLVATLSIHHYLLAQIVDFWVEGVFGVQWLGKAYFILTAAVSTYLAWRWRIIEKKTSFYTHLRLFLRCLEVLLVLTRCFPNMEISCIFAVAAMSRDTLLAWAHYVWITAAAARQSPTYIYSSQPLLSSDEYERQGKIHTRNALTKLRDHLRTPEGQKKMDEIIDWYALHSSRLYDFAINLHRFSKGYYSGTPACDNNENIINKLSDSSESESQSSSISCLSLVWTVFVYLILSSIAVLILLI